MSITRLMACALLSAATGACSLATSGTTPATQSIIEQRQAAINRMRFIALHPLVDWEQETPPSCTSPNLGKARSLVLAAAGMQTPEKQGLDVVIEGGGWVLQVADAARQHHCTVVARNLYDTVIATYTGSAYAALRQRAQIGIEDLRQ
jgi:hypothetical protein